MVFNGRTSCSSPERGDGLEELVGLERLGTVQGLVRDVVGAGRDRSPRGESLGAETTTVMPRVTSSSWTPGEHQLRFSRVKRRSNSGPLMAEVCHVVVRGRCAEFPARGPTCRIPGSTAPLHGCSLRPEARNIVVPRGRARGLTRSPFYRGPSRFPGTAVRIGAGGHGERVGEEDQRCPS